jgi:hypothetical protein
MKHLIFFIATFTGLMTVNAQQDTTIELTTVEFESRTIDYGKISKGANGTRTFTFENTGEHPLIIYKVFSSSYSKVVSYPEKPTASGEKGEIVIKYDTNKLGPIVKTITVQLNIKEKLIPLNLKGTVVE